MLFGSATKHSFLIRSAPHTAVTLEFEADTPGPGKTKIRAGRGLSVVGAFKLKPFHGGLPAELV